MPKGESTIRVMMEDITCIIEKRLEHISLPPGFDIHVGKIRRVKLNSGLYLVVEITTSGGVSIADMIQVAGKKDNFPLSKDVYEKPLEILCKRMISSLTVNIKDYLREILSEIEKHDKKSAKAA